MTIQGAQKTIIETAKTWDGVKEQPHRFGGIALRVGRREVGHVHGDKLVDIPFPKPVRDQLVQSGDAEPHHILPNTGWISVLLEVPGDVDRAIRLLRRSYEELRLRDSLDEFHKRDE